MYLLGYDIGSSSVKASIVDAANGQCMASAFYPRKEMEIKALKPGWAEQDPGNWWENLKLSTKEVLRISKVKPNDIHAIGISYQMHGLVLVDKNQNVLRPSIIWCDSRAVHIGEKAFSDLGDTKCLSSLLNSPGNFTASKLKWVKDSEPEIYSKIDKIMLPGDYIAMKLTGEICTTVSGLSEGMFWDFQNHQVASFLMDYYGFDHSLIPKLVPTFAEQGRLSDQAAQELGLAKGISIAYRAGDQPNNAFSLNVLNPGEIAATAGTSGVVYGVSSEIKYDPQSRVNTFAHVNHRKGNNRLGVLLCINGTGILNSWIKKNTGFTSDTYEKLNEYAASVPVGSDGLSLLPFGNGSERMLGNRNMGCQISNLNFNLHTNNHLLRATQEGIVFAFHYGMEIMKQSGILPSVIRAGNANMFLSPVFKETLAGITGATIELYNTDGSIGAARGAGIGSGIYKNYEESFLGLQKLQTVQPDHAKSKEYKDAYQNWIGILNKNII
jgi:xylulokinase